MPLDIDAVSTLLMDVAATAILPRHRALAASDIQEKSPGELVTIADRDAESLLTAGLTHLLPGVPVVGEEAAALDASTLSLVEDSPLLWLVDPLDGTANFVAGSPDFAMMVALVQKGETEAAWIYRPADGQMYVAQRSAGAYANGQRLHRAPAPPEIHALQGAVLTRFLSPEQKKNVYSGARQMRHVGPGRVCAGIDYPLVAEGAQDFVLFWRTLPWDHAPGALITTEAGGHVAHLDGAAYRPDRPREGLLAAADPDTHKRVVELLGLQ